MYYNNNDKILIDSLPKVLIKEDGSFFVDFDKSSAEIASDYGYYTVSEDSLLNIPDNAITENIDSMQVILNKPYAKIIRSWLISPREE